MHGKSCLITHAGQGLFKTLASPLTVGRYHSLVACRDTLPTCLEATAYDSIGEIMALQHTKYPIFGLQFHPESILTEQGHEFLRNYFNLLST
jgi:anthranilate synthase component 2